MSLMDGPLVKVFIIKKGVFFLNLFRITIAEFRKKKNQMICISFYFVDVMVKTIIYLSKIRIEESLLKKYGDKKRCGKKMYSFV